MSDLQQLDVQGAHAEEGSNVNESKSLFAVYTVTTVTTPGSSSTVGWELPSDSEGVVRLQDETGNEYHAATSSGGLIYFSRETESGTEVILDARGQVREGDQVLMC